MIRKIACAVAIVLLVMAAYLSLWPVPIRAVAWKAPAAPGYTGPHTANDKLAGLTLIQLGAEAGPEHIVLARDGKLYAAMASGNIVRMNPDGSAQEVFANTGGRVLGFDFDAAGRLIAADAVKGLLAVGTDRKVTLLTNQVGGDPIRYADAVVVARTGKIYFSDASARFSPAQWGGTFEAAVLDIIEQASTGRILEYDPAADATRIVVKGLSFANGVALSSDEQTLFAPRPASIACGRSALRPTTSTWARALVTAGEHPVRQPARLPGQPDARPRRPHLARLLRAAQPGCRRDGRKAVHARAHAASAARAVALPKRYGHVMAFSEDGKIVADLQDPSGTYPRPPA
jgi:hypothetical protein